MLKFTGKTIPGSSGPVIGGGPELPAKTVQYWDVKGDAEIVGQEGGRNLFVQHTLYNNCETPKDLQDELDKLQALVGKHGDLRQTEGEIDNAYEHCTFRGWEPDVLPGQRDPGMLKDVAGTLLDDEGEPDGGWFVTIMLQFRQLLVKVKAS